MHVQTQPHMTCAQLYAACFSSTLNVLYIQYLEVVILSLCPWSFIIWKLNPAECYLLCHTCVLLTVWQHRCLPPLFLPPCGDFFCEFSSWALKLRGATVLHLNRWNQWLWPSTVHMMRSALRQKPSVFSWFDSSDRCCRGGKYWFLDCNRVPYCFLKEKKKKNQWISAFFNFQLDLVLTLHKVCLFARISFSVQTSRCFYSVEMQKCCRANLFGRFDAVRLVC